MKRKKSKPPSKPRSKPAQSKQAAPRVVEEDEPSREEEQSGRIVERPDGYYWEAKSGREYGPYTTLAEAEADMLSGEPTEPAEAADSLPEAESEIGVAEWIDPDTGIPAEDSVPRLEDH